MWSRWGWIGAVVIIAIVVVTLGVRTPVRSARTAGESLGPSSGEQVQGYLADVRSSIPGSGGPYWALVSLRSELTPAAAAAVPGPARLSMVVLRVALERVQTAQVSVGLSDQGERVVELQGVMASAADQLQRSAATEGRAAAVAEVSVSRLRSDCACVLALLIRGSADALSAVAARPEVRAVQAAPGDTPPQRLSLSPLLPEQTTVVAPTPDDGPVPAA